MKTVISNGSYKFHLAPLASELARMKNLSAFITAGYVDNKYADLLTLLPLDGIKRLLDRKEDIPIELVNSLFLPELYFKFGDFFLRKISQDWQHKIHIRGFEIYSEMAMSILKSTKFDIYHYRNCYGLKSAEWARDHNKKTICDHSIGHPVAISYLLNKSHGILADFIEMQELNRLESHFLKDFEHADAILVNSDFVKKTFEVTGYPSHKVHVVYLGVDEKFLNPLENLSSKKVKSNKDLLFCGQWGPRKGAIQIMEALDKLADEDWTLTIAGGIDPKISHLWNIFYNKHRNRVNNLGILSRAELAKTMLKYPVFVFPSLLEGSARVVFEALACKCFVVTTPNSGSIVKEGVNGAIIEAGSSESLVLALKKIWNNSYDISEIGKYNHNLVRSNFRQQQYANRVLDVYKYVMEQ